MLSSTYSKLLGLSIFVKDDSKICNASHKWPFTASCACLDFRLEGFKDLKGKYGILEAQLL